MQLHICSTEIYYLRRDNINENSKSVTIYTHIWMQIRISAYICIHAYTYIINLSTRGVFSQTSKMERFSKMVNYFHQTVLLRCLTGVASKPMSTLFFSGLPNLPVLFLSTAINLTVLNILITVIIATLKSICLNPLLHAVKS